MGVDLLNLNNEYNVSDENVRDNSERCETFAAGNRLRVGWGAVPRPAGGLDGRLTAHPSSREIAIDNFHGYLAHKKPPCPRTLR